MRLKLVLFFLCSCLCIYSYEGANLELLISSQAIEQRIQEVAGELEKEYRGKELVLLSVMKGAVCVTSDLMRALSIPCTIEFIRASSYGKNGTKRGALTISGLDGLDLREKHVLVIDDILDSGYTMKGIVEHLQAKQPQSIKTLVLLSKNIPRDSNYTPDYALFEIPDRFVIGYGLDYKEYYRNLPAIYAFPGDIPHEISH